MWIFIAIIAAFVLLITWLLWARMVVCVNSYHNRYYFSFGGLVVVEPWQRAEDFLLRIKVPFFSFYVDPFKLSRKTARLKRKKKPKSKKGRKLKLTFYLNWARAALRTFTIKRLQMDMDTGDFVLNAKLTPILFGLSQGDARLQVNYQGQTNLWLEIENRLVRFIPVGFRYLKAKYL